MNRWLVIPLMIGLVCVSVTFIGGDLNASAVRHVDTSVMYGNTTVSGNIVNVTEDGYLIYGMNSQHQLNQYVGTSSYHVNSTIGYDGWYCTFTVSFTTYTMWIMQNISHGTYIEISDTPFNYDVIYSFADLDQLSNMGVIDVPLQSDYHMVLTSMGDLHTAMINHYGFDISMYESSSPLVGWSIVSGLGYIGMIVAIIAGSIVAGTQVFGTGLNMLSQMMIFKLTLYLSIWGVVSISIVQLTSGMPMQVSIMLYSILTFPYLIGMSDEIKLGGH